MQLDTSCCYLVLHSGSDGYSRKIAIVESLGQGLSGWTSCSRVSPIWPITGLKSGRNANPFSESRILTFVGPCQPARLSGAIPLETDASVVGLWLTPGCFNIVLCTDAAKAGAALSAAVTDFCRTNAVAYEQWAVADGVIQSATHHVLSDDHPGPIFQRLGKFAKSHDHPALRPTFQENLVATATSLTRAAAVYPPIFRELSEVAEATCKIMEVYEAKKLSLFDMQSRLLSLNAALSRFSSQAFSGIPPIRETECHFWIHSLLGTGSANIALANLVSSIQQTLGEARLPQRLAQMLDMTRKVPTLDDLTSGTAILDLDLISQVDLDHADKTKVLPLVTYFSGRDGFSSHLQTLSAPLTTLAECNSWRSNLLTVTHEISHIFVQSALAELGPVPGEAAELSKALEILSPRYQAKNYLDAARQLFLEAVVGIKQVERDESFDDSQLAVELEAMLQDTRHEVQEILVHTFDFLYFHAGEPEYYISSIWHSWCSIPGIADRIPDYLMRTLCAVSANLLTHKPDKRFFAALAATKDLLRAVEPTIGIADNYVTHALRYIDKIERDSQLRERTEMEYHVRVYLVRLVKIFLFSETLSARLFADSHIGGGKTGYRTKKSLVYDTNPIGNYLQFLRAQLKKDPSEAESIWVLHCLAFDKSDSDGSSL